MKYLATGAAVLLAGAWALAVPAHASNINVLWYNGVSDGFESSEDTLSTPGTGDPSSTTWSITHWYDGNAMPAGTFNVLVVGSASSGGSGSLLSNLPTFGDRIFVTGQDADYHITNGPGLANFDGPRGFLRDAINWAGAGTGLGLVVLSPGEGAVQLSDLAIVGIGNDTGGTNTVVIPGAYATFPINTGLTTGGLSNWDTSSHNDWLTVSSAWTGINTDGSSGFVTLVSAETASGGISGIPEPASLAILGLGLAGLGVVRRRRQ